MEQLSYVGKKVCITGASSGIGRCFAEKLHQLGANLLLVARRESLLQELTDGFNQDRHQSCEFMVVDLVNTEQLGKLETRLREENFDILINNAGQGSFGEFDKLVIAGECNLVSLNIISFMRLSYAAIPGMKLKGGGSIINISSVAGFVPLPFMATYSSTKAFNLSHSLALAEELKRFKIRVLAVCPGPTDTEFGGVARIPGTLTGVGRDNPYLVVDQSLEALERDRKLVITGTRSKFICWLIKILPLRLSVCVAGNVLYRTYLKAARGS